MKKKKSEVTPPVPPEGGKKEPSLPERPGASARPGIVEPGKRVKISEHQIKNLHSLDSEMNFNKFKIAENYIRLKEAEDRDERLFKERKSLHAQIGMFLEKYKKEHKIIGVVSGWDVKTNELVIG